MPHTELAARGEVNIALRPRAYSLVGKSDRTGRNAEHREETRVEGMSNAHS